MRRIYLIAAATFATIGAAVAQQTTTPPGGNVPVAQSPCARGYDAAMKEGKLSAQSTKSADTNNDGKLSKSEFDAACAKKLFDDTEKKG